MKYILFVLIIFLAACTSNTGIANPASVNCDELGGTLSIENTPEGQIGMCHLSDGTICEEWALYRGECPVLGCQEDALVCDDGSVVVRTPEKNCEFEECPPLPNDKQSCVTNDDCIPFPECHPKTCINQKYELEYKKPEICTMMFDNEAAYNKEDCSCENGICINTKAQNYQ